MIGSKNLEVKYTDTFILDFEKAFETSPHELLKCKLRGYGISGKTLVWIDSSLCNRQQMVVVNGAKSQWVPVLSDVPQGTVLGPLLFSLYIDDIMVGIESEIRLFADDCVCYRQIDSTEKRVREKSGECHNHKQQPFPDTKRNPVSILRKSISDRHRPVRVADGPMTVRCRFT